MKLTKDELRNCDCWEASSFDNGKDVLINCSSKKEANDTIDQILKWQEDAVKWRGFDKILEKHGMGKVIDYWKSNQDIVERLKKKLGEFQFMNEYSGHKTTLQMAVIHDVHSILQKILEGKDD